MWPLPGPPGPGPCGDPCPPPGGHRGPAAGPLSAHRLQAHLRPAAARLAIDPASQQPWTDTLVKG